MSELSDNLNNIVIDRAPATTDPVLNLTTGLTFTAEIEGNLDPFTIPEQWGSDPRPKVRLHVTDDGQAAGISETDLVRFSIYGNSAVGIVVHRIIDPASPQTKFLVCIKSPKDV